MIKEYEYLDEQHKKAIDEMLAREEANQPKLPAPSLDTIGPDGTIRLGTGNPLRSPEDLKPKKRNNEETRKEVQEKYEVEEAEAEGIVNTIDDFLDEIG